MSQIVNTAAELHSALKAAKAGDTIQLAPGAYAVSISGVRVAEGVTVTSQYADRPAILTGLSVRDSGGITFTDLKFSVDAKSAFQVASSQDIHFARLHVHGSLDGDPKNDEGGLLVRGSTDVSITDSEFEQLYWAISHLDNNGLTIQGNSFHDLRMDGIRGGGSSNVLVDGNTFRDFFPKDGDHNDAIQFWTGNTTASARNITISNNAFQRGAGEPTQGIFMRDEARGLQFENVKIVGNLIAGGLGQGIGVYGARNVVIENNVVQGFSDQKSWLRIDAVHGAVLKGNAASLLLVGKDTSGVVTGDNTTLPLAADGGGAAVSLWNAVKGATPLFKAAALGGETLNGDGLDNVLGGQAGDDRILAGGGSDTVNGGAGRDYLRGQDGDDSISGGDDFDDIHGNAGRDTAAGGDGDDWVVGGKDSDRLSGDAGDDLVYGNMGADTLNGGAGNDVVRGGQDNDILVGGLGDDWMSGDRGWDTLTGGDGADTFHAFAGSGVDRVLDFNALEGDRIQLQAGARFEVTQSGADTVLTLTSGDQLVLANTQMASLPDGWVLGF